MPETHDSFRDPVLFTEGVSEDEHPNGAAAECAQVRVPRALNEGRSRNMRANRRSGTKPEVAVRSALHARGLRFRKDFLLRLGDGIRVKPDVVFTARHVAVFVDGCFWHVCPEHGRYPSTNDWYWTPKLRRNMERDRRVNAALNDAGWQAVRVWEHEPVSAVVARVESLVRAAPRP